MQNRMTGMLTDDTMVHVQTPFYYSLTYTPAPFQPACQSSIGCSAVLCPGTNYTCRALPLDDSDCWKCPPLVGIPFPTNICLGYV